MTKNIKGKPIRTPSAYTEDNRPIEMIFDRQENKTRFCLINGNRVDYQDKYLRDRKHKDFVPIPSDSDLLAKGVVLFPEKAASYKSEAWLVNEVREFIHKYVDIPEVDEAIASYYVLFTWLYDKFREVPYLRAKGDYGSGKTRFIYVVGSICYKPVFAAGAITSAPIFRVIEGYHGTLILDETDFRNSDLWADIVKILNVGHSKGIPVLRCDEGSRHEPRSFDVFCPKILASRDKFKDEALESRFLTIHMVQKLLRPDVPINLTEKFDQEAQMLRNKLLMFRLKNFSKKSLDESLVNPAIEPRLNQIFVPLLSIVDNSDIRHDLQKLAKEQNTKILESRGMQTEAQILELICEEIDKGTDPIYLKNITSDFTDKYENDYSRKITANWLSWIIRDKLNITTQRSREGVIIPRQEVIEDLRKTYRIQPIDITDAKDYV